MIVDIARLDPRWDRVPVLEELCRRAAEAAAAASHRPVAADAELSLVLSDDARVAELNSRYRGRDGPTNVLSFAGGADASVAGAPAMLGDVVLAFETIGREANSQGKTFESHLCHLVIHGVLHLLGYDHLDAASAEEMEGIEVSALAKLSIPNPY